MTGQGWILEWGKGPQEVEIGSAVELDGVLDRIDVEARGEGRPVAVILHSSAGRSVTIGLGRGFAVLGYDDPNAEHPSFFVPGEEDGGEPSEWYYGNQVGEWPPGAGVSVETARAALHEFRRTGERPTCVEWVE